MFSLALIMRIFCCLVVVFFCSCSGFFGGGKSTSPQEMDFFLSGSSPSFNEKDIAIRVDSMGNSVHFNVSSNDLNKFPFPKDDKGQSLSATSLNFEILENGKPIINSLFQKTEFNRVYPATKYLSGSLAYTSDTIDLKNGLNENFEIPMYAFYKLKAGLHQLQLRVSQTVFCSPLTHAVKSIDSLSKDTVTTYVRNYKKGAMFFFTVNFRINVPELYETVFYSKGIELRNDSIYSPAGMDNTLWNSSYPDMYWTISYPEEEYYCSSYYQKSTDIYTTKDTFPLIHYYPADSVALGIWDHDNLSHDDFISYKRFSISQFANNKITGLTFQNIKLFKLKCERKGRIN